MKWNAKIRAGALQFVLFIGVVVALLLLTFVTLSHTHSFFGKKTELFVHTLKKANLGIDQAMKTAMVFNDSISLNIGLEDQIQLKGIKEHWGVFEKYTVVATAKKNRFTKSVLVGNGISKELPALYLQDNERPMIIVGNAKITGDAYLPKQGIRPGNIAGHSFYNKTMVFGRQQQSSSELPKLDLDLRQHLDVLSRGGFSAVSNEILSLSNEMAIGNSFKSPTKYIYGDIIDLTGISLTGNILVRANRQIIVGASSKLQDVVLMAPKITVKDNVVGTFQAIASNNITVGKKCSLGYPSALVVNNISRPSNTPNAVRLPDLFVDSNAIIKGLVIYIGQKKEQQYTPQIKINDKTTIWGELYCEQNLELKGNVIGAVTTNTFMALERGSIYQNHLFNGTINREMLPPQYAGLLLAGNKNTKAISKWLY